MKPYIWISDVDELTYKEITEAGISPVPMGNDINNQTFSSGDEVVVIASGERAKNVAAQLVSRGVSEIRMNYVDLQPGDDLRARLQKPKHMRWDDVVPISEIEDPTDDPYFESGLGFLDKNLRWRWRMPELVVMAGPYSSGKSTVAQILAASFVNGPGRQLLSGAMLCSWEDIGYEVRENMHRFGAGVRDPDLSNRVHFVRRHPDDDRLIGWYMELVEYHFHRYGTRFFVLDPWNEMDHQKDIRQNETDYVRDMMKAFRRLVDRLKIILIIATHVPAKIIKGDGSIEAFKIGQAFGSVQFANKADRGLCVLRTKKFERDRGHTILRVDKSKIERRMGQKGTLALRLNEETFSFEYDADITNEVKDIWKD